MSRLYSLLAGAYLDIGFAERIEKGQVQSSDKTEAFIYSFTVKLCNCVRLENYGYGLLIYHKFGLLSRK